MKDIAIYRKQEGFTLIETLVTVVIVGVVAAIAIPSFTGWMTTKRIEDTLARVEGALKEARSSAVKKNRSCTLLITVQNVSAIRVDSVTGSTSPDPACLPSGERDFSGINPNISLLGTGGTSGTLVTFSLRGTTPITQTTEAILVRRRDRNDDQKIKCLVLSSGIGAIRTGSYSESTVPTLEDLPSEPIPADPNNITAADTAARSAWIATRDARNVQVANIVDRCVSPL
jgi:prepilin-type N-terminal cleavage/methylation domain-containing protein